MWSKTIELVYIVSCDDPNLHLDPLAIRPTFESNKVMWEDTGPGTVVNMKNAVMPGNSPEKIEFETDKGQHITLTKLTVDLFNNKIRDRAAGHPEFHSDKELQDYYLNTNFDYYGP
jgi:hypothetical protein